MECNHFWIYDWWLFSTSEFVALSPFLIYVLTSAHYTGGPRSAFGSAVACGILLGVFEGVGVLMSRVFSEGSRPQMAPSTH